jgi:hypothetical protein
LLHSLPGVRLVTWTNTGCHPLEPCFAHCKMTGVRSAAPCARVVVVANPANTNALILSNYAVGLYTLNAIDPELESAWFQPLSL